MLQQGVIVKPILAKIPEELAITLGKKSEGVILVSIFGFRFVEKSEYGESIFEGEEYSAYSLFEASIASKFQGKIQSLEVHVYKFGDEVSAENTFLVFAGPGLPKGKF